MSYFIDLKYLNQIGYRLPLFTKKKPDLWNCRCIICGDSTTNKKKARGYFYRKKNDLMYKCHNCAASQHFGTFLESFDPTMYQQYVFERYAKGENGPKAHKNPEEFLMDFTPKFKQKPEEIFDPLTEVAQRLDTLPDENEAVKYCLARDIPVDRFKDLYYISSVKDIVKIAPQYDSIKTEEPRLLIPFYNERGALTGVTMRALRGEALRYIMVKLVEDEPLLFGMNRLDLKQDIYVVEGSIDSLFLENAIACNGTSFGKLETLNLPKEKVTVIFDNQPRNQEVCRLVEKYIKMNYRVCIWPAGIQEKDINDMVKGGRKITQLIRENTFQGMLAQLKFVEWRKC